MNLEQCNCYWSKHQEEYMGNMINLKRHDRIARYSEHRKSVRIRNRIPFYLLLVSKHTDECQSMYSEYTEPIYHFIFLGVTVHAFYLVIDTSVGMFPVFWYLHLSILVPWKNPYEKTHMFTCSLLQIEQIFHR
ncbi:hypothetical protein BDB01DRAFT_893725 [Pilobolus umbonatus]|nr:hypothetical protein BDB01DRAFT_893725 [Pilobolus umbonatus]